MKIREDLGVSELISLVLILGIITALFTVLLAVVVPMYDDKRNGEHLLLLEDEFSSLKTGIDMLWLQNATGVEKQFLFSPSANHQSSGKLEVGVFPLDITSDEGVYSLPLLRVTYAESGTLQYCYVGGALYCGDLCVLPASVSQTHTVFVCLNTSIPFSLYANSPVALSISLKKKETYHNVHHEHNGESSTGVLTVWYFDVWRSDER